MEKILLRLRVFSFVFVSLFLASAVSAKTLREMAQTSNLLLVLADSLSSQDAEVKKRRCGMSYKQISARAQKLKAQIDQKISGLTPKELKIIESRTGNCQQDCTCDIYAMALEKREKNSDKMAEKAAQLTAEDRAKCTTRLKNICQRAKQ